MRQTITISLPTELKKFVEQAVKEGSFSSASEFFRELLRRKKEAEAIDVVLASEREFARGKGKLLRSLKTLRTRNR